ncbi:3225_t:CDS:1, partial [Dentiscutata heterogama]
GDFCANFQFMLLRKLSNLYYLLIGGNLHIYYAVASTKDVSDIS